MDFDIICQTEGQEPYVLDHARGSDILPALLSLREHAFNFAASGHHGDYPYDDTFNDKVEEGFADTGALWMAENGTILRIEKIQ